MMKKIMFAALIVCSTASFNANAGIQDGVASVLSWFGLEMSPRTSKPVAPKEW